MPQLYLSGIIAEYSLVHHRWSSIGAKHSSIQNIYIPYINQLQSKNFLSVAKATLVILKGLDERSIHFIHNNCLIFVS